MHDHTLRKEDYEEPVCLLNMERSVTPIPVQRVMEKLDEYLARDDYAGAERHLRYWLAEAESGSDLRGKLTISNEQIGLYRKLGRGEESLAAAVTALDLVRALDLENSVTMGTTLVNAATAYKAFGQAETALPLYEQARTLYETLLPEGDGRLGGLYNNMALTLVDLARYREAEALYTKALEVMSCIPHRETELAITWCNMADLICAEAGMEAGEAAIGECLDKAEALLNTPDLPRDAYYAFVCEKCAPTFGYYGYFLTQRTLQARSDAIYGRFPGARL